MHIGIVFEVNLNRKRIQRSVYSLLDWIGDVGGLLEAMFVSFSILVAVFHYKTFEKFMVENLFLRKGSVDDASPMRFEKISRLKLWYFNTTLLCCKRCPKLGYS